MVVLPNSSTSWAASKCCRGSSKPQMFSLKFNINHQVVKEIIKQRRVVEQEIRFFFVRNIFLNFRLPSDCERQEAALIWRLKPGRVFFSPLQLQVRRLFLPTNPALPTCLRLYSSSFLPVWRWRKIEGRGYLKGTGCNNQEQISVIIPYQPLISRNFAAGSRTHTHYFVYHICNICHCFFLQGFAKKDFIDEKKR